MRERSSIFDQLPERNELERRQEEVHEEEDAAPEPIEPPPPPRFHANELSFERPAGMQDGTWHVLSHDLTAPGFTIVVGRAAVTADQNLESLAQQVQEQLVASVDPTFKQHVHEHVVAGQPARRLQFSRRQEGSLVHQDQVLLLWQDEFEHPLLMQFIATSANPTGMTATEREQFETLLASVELRGQDDAPNAGLEDGSPGEEDNA